MGVMKAMIRCHGPAESHAACRRVIIASMYRMCSMRRIAGLCDGRVRKWTLLVSCHGELRRYVAADSKPYLHRAIDLPWSPARSTSIVCKGHACERHYIMLSMQAPLRCGAGICS